MLLKIGMVAFLLSSSSSFASSQKEDLNCAYTIDELGRVSESASKLSLAGCETRTSRLSCEEIRILKESYEMQTKFLKWKLNHFDCKTKDNQ